MKKLQQLDILELGVEVWNRWREEHPDIQPNFYGTNLSKFYYSSLSGVDLRNAVLIEADLSFLDLRAANLTGAQLIGANLSYANLSSAKLNRADLTSAELIEADFSEAKLEGATLNEAMFGGANFNRANLRSAHLVNVGLAGVYLNRANLRDANLSNADLSESQLHKAWLTGANLAEARLIRANLSEADLRKAKLTGADFRIANLIGAKLDEANITDAWLWETQRDGWSIQGIVCEAVYWDKDRKERKRFEPGEFERLYAAKTKVVLLYEGGIASPIEIATLPSMIDVMQKWSGCVLRLDSLQDAPGGATVTIVIENPGNRTSAQVEALQAELERRGQQIIDIQRAWFQERDGRLRAEGARDFMHINYFSPLMERVMGKSQEITITGSNVFGHVGQISGGEYTFNDLTAIKKLVDEIFERRTELSLTSEKLANLESSIQTVQAQFAVQTPSHSIIREAVRSLRNIIEGAIGSTIASGWLPLLQRLG